MDTGDQYSSVLSSNEICQYKRAVLDGIDGRSLFTTWLTSPHPLNEDALRNISTELLQSYLKDNEEDMPGQSVSNIVGNLDSQLVQCFLMSFLMATRKSGGMNIYKLGKVCSIFGVRYFWSMSCAVERNGWNPEFVGKIMNAMTERNILFPQKHPAILLFDVYQHQIHGCSPAQIKMLIKPFYAILASRSNQICQRIARYSRLHNLLESKFPMLKGADEFCGSGCLDFPRKFMECAAMFSHLYEDKEVPYDLQALGWLCKKLIASTDSGFSQNESQVAASSRTHNNQEGSETISQNQENSIPRVRRVEGIEKSNAEVIVKWFFNEEKNKNVLDIIEWRKIKIDDAGRTSPVLCNEAGHPEFSFRESNVETEQAAQDDMDVDILNTTESDDLFQLEGECSSPMPSDLLPVSPSHTGSKKRKRLNNVERECPEECKFLGYNYQDDEEEDEDQICVNGDGKKRVRFSLKHNIVWKPHNPLPPVDLRVPPSAMPRGSALKKGVSPGPISVMKKSPRKKQTPKKSGAVRRTPTKSKNKKRGFVSNDAEEFVISFDSFESEYHVCLEGRHHQMLLILDNTRSVFLLKCIFGLLYRRRSKPLKALALVD